MVVGRKWKCGFLLQVGPAGRPYTSPTLRCDVMLEPGRHVCKASVVVHLFAENKAILETVNLLTEICMHKACTIISRKRRSTHHSLL